MFSKKTILNTEIKNNLKNKKMKTRYLRVQISYKHDTFMNNIISFLKNNDQQIFNYVFINPETIQLFEWESGIIVNIMNIEENKEIQTEENINPKKENNQKVFIFIKFFY